MKKYFWLFFSLLFALSVFGVACDRSSLSPRQVFERCADGVAELKCVAETGESYGTAELISRDGDWITNAHVVTYTRSGAVCLFETYWIRTASEKEYRRVD